MFSKSRNWSTETAGLIDKKYDKSPIFSTTIHSDCPLGGLSMECVKCLPALYKLDRLLVLRTLGTAFVHGLNLYYHNYIANYISRIY